jgi:hypothetical protein
MYLVDAVETAGREAFVVEFVSGCGPAKVDSKCLQCIINMVA